MNTYYARIEDATEEARPLAYRLYDACRNSGRHDVNRLARAVDFASIQLDPEEDDYETWKATVMAHYDAQDKIGVR